ncbi:MAG: Bro-N domain-containing protein, partial [Synergistaceae bacterium]|nr:Bro-N domain-containing protein [Synergistaceae bacterium]
MENTIKIFTYNNNEVRTVIQNGEVWFVAKDVCDILELTNVTKAIKSLDDDEKM